MCYKFQCSFISILQQRFHKLESKLIENTCVYIKTSTVYCYLFTPLNRFVFAPWSSLEILMDARRIMQWMCVDF